MELSLWTPNVAASWQKIPDPTFAEFWALNDVSLRLSRAIALALLAAMVQVNRRC
jgi:hypothetical protein